MKIHNFPSTDIARDVDQLDGARRSDVIVIESEKVVAVATLSPFAVTAHRGDMHTLRLTVISSPHDPHTLAEGVRKAVAEAKRGPKLLQGHV